MFEGEGEELQSITVRSRLTTFLSNKEDYYVGLFCRENMPSENSSNRLGVFVSHLGDDIDSGREFKAKKH